MLLVYVVVRLSVGIAAAAVVVVVGAAAAVPLVSMGLWMSGVQGFVVPVVATGVLVVVGTVVAVVVGFGSYWGTLPSVPSLKFFRCYY